MVDNIVFKTTNYGLFKNFLGNRDIKTCPDLLNSIEKNGLITPIVVDSNLRVIDGQHRLKVCESLHIPIEYIVRDFGEDIIVDVNRYQMKWTATDFLESHVKRGFKSYILFKELLKKYRLNINQGLLVFRGNGTRLPKAEMNAFEAGGFILDDQDMRIFHNTMALLEGVFATSSGANESKFRHGNLFAALVQLVNHSMYSHDWFLQRLEATPDHKIKPYGTISDMRIFLESIYNHHIRKGRIFLSKKK